MKPLTKSRFKLGLECPNKLYFTGKAAYANKKVEDSFLQALAQGGFQVEALARLHYPEGIFVDAKNYEYDKAIEITKTALEKNNVCLYEAAFTTENLFVKSDIVQKNGSNVKLIEVKSKSFDPADLYALIGKKGGVVSAWKPYLFDLAFQKYVAQKSFPQFNFTAYLMLADKTKKATIDGLNQMFRIRKDTDPRKEIDYRIENAEELGESILCEINVDDLINEILNGNYAYFEGLSFEETVGLLQNYYTNNIYADSPCKHSACKACEFKSTPLEEENGLLSGFKHCFTKQFGWSKTEFEKPNVLQIWDCRDGKLLDQGKILMEDLSPEDLKLKPEAGRISRTERQMLQVEKAVANDLQPYILVDELKAEIATWQFPLHFIDFETSTVALPFTKGRKPYEQVAFQFSHHVYYEDGRVEHKTEYINDNPGEFPNFKFAEALKNALQNDAGTIFRFADHENTIINAIIKQINDDPEQTDEGLIDFLKSISHSSKNSVQEWEGERDMVDLRKIILNYYYNPLTNGSNSLKYVLPAILNTSNFLQTKYSQPLSEINVSSKNFPNNHIWLNFEGNQVINPYKQLPKLFADWDQEKIKETLSDLESIADGGAALTAYSKLQFTDMSNAEREELRKSLLKYCELDTLAMVMLYEHFTCDF
ncbi:DUF2779 domain-containing protein [Chryseobacterium indoltheticum]|uniref:Domain of uncharacterized function(DUF2779) n=1 Tax=Chryseobacterium indoltheticum TaxID=254 RepID=A0A381FPR2_9FLAO|nr:DUF2779 domain-containing protein [Chryseobacterium indoltheticum]SUX48556.1 Domain of uncharacterised function(DUF2779) [Chryseobacterium indoltheticum]